VCILEINYFHCNYTDSNKYNSCINIVYCLLISRARGGAVG
jgi:hypothetical protein